MRVLVTGGTGFIGRQAVGSLIASGAQVHLHCRHPHQIFMNIPTTFGDLTDPAAARELMQKARPDVLLHLAWNVEHGKFWTNRQNIDWTAASLLLARAALDFGVRRIVGIGTCYEYSWPREGNCHEVETGINPTSLYAVAKDATRRVLEELSDISFTWARLFYLFGPYEHAERLVSSLSSSLARGETAYLSSGKVVRDFMHTRDAGAALAALALSEVNGAVNIATGEGYSVASIAECLGRIAGRPDLIRIGALRDREGEPPRIVAEVGRLRDEVGFRPSLTLQEGLADVYSWWRERLEYRQ